MINRLPSWAGKIHNPPTRSAPTDFAVSFMSRSLEYARPSDPMETLHIAASATTSSSSSPDRLISAAALCVRATARATDRRDARGLHILRLSAQRDHVPAVLEDRDLLMKVLSL
jgi:hypothetical protein